MTYELAKQLKDAGFPQGESFENVLTQGIAMAYLRESKPDDVLLDKYEKALNSLRAMYEDDKEWVYQPSLSELIEACGDIILFKLPKENEWESELNGSWVAVQSSVYADSIYLCASDMFIDTSFSGETGSTPEEAVANLWLALNAKD